MRREGSSYEIFLNAFYSIIFYSVPEYCLKQKPSLQTNKKIIMYCAQMYSATLFAYI